jgi:nitrate reductase (NAD(P)H)
VKWVQRISIRDSESTSFYHLHDNKILPPWVEATTPDLEDWLADPAFTIWEPAINSYIVEPHHGMVVPLSADPLPIKGCCYVGAGRWVAMVFISIDGGKEWRPCTVSYPVPPRHTNKFWCVGFWEPVEPISALDLYATGNPEIVVKAYDSNRASQPEKPVWSYLGYGNSCWYRVKVLRRISETVPLYQFQHPVTQRDADLATSSGWMSVHKRQREELQDAVEVSPAVPAQLPEIPEAEVAKHNTKNDAWLLIDGVVHNITEYYQSNKHPGGNGALDPFLGQECTDAFVEIGHSSGAKVDLGKCAIGVVKGGKRAKGMNMTDAVDTGKMGFAAACALASFFAVKIAQSPTKATAKSSSKAPHFVACAVLASLAVRIFGPKKLLGVEE